MHFFSNSIWFSFWAPILSDVENQSNHFKGTQSSSCITQAIPDYISITFKRFAGTSFPPSLPTVELLLEQWGGGLLLGPSTWAVRDPKSHQLSCYSVMISCRSVGTCLTTTFWWPSSRPGVTLCPYPPLYSLISVYLLVPTVALGPLHMPSRTDVGSLPLL